MPELPNNPGTQSTVTVYTTTNCSRCVLTKRFLARLGVPFHEISIFLQEHAAEELKERTGALEAPVTIVGSRFVRGYNPQSIAALLQEEGWDFNEDSDKH